MSDKPSSQPAKDSRNAIWRYTLGLFLLIWCLICLISLMSGFGAQGALFRASAGSVSGLAGWMVYLRISRPAGIDLDASISGQYVWMPQPGLMARWNTDTFLEMLAFGLLYSVLVASTLGLTHRVWSRGKRIPQPGAHPLSDDRVDPPL